MSKRTTHPAARVMAVCLVLTLLVVTSGYASAHTQDVTTRFIQVAKLTASDGAVGEDDGGSIYMSASFEPAAVKRNGGSFSDDFGSSSLDPNWTWVDPLGDCSYSLTANPGYLRLYAPDRGHDLYLNLNAPRMVQPVQGDFVATTKVTINPTYNYQGAGLLIWQDEDNYIRLERTLVSGIDMWYRIAGAYGGIEIPFSASTVYLRLQRAGDSFTAWYSENASVWTVVSTIDCRASKTLHVGLDLVNEWQDNPIWADFDFFRLSGGPWRGIGDG